MKNIVFFCFLTLISVSAFGQLSLGLGAGYYMPMITGNGYNSNVGFNAEIEFEKLGMGLRTGYQNFSGTDGDYKLTITPVTLFSRSYFGKNMEKKFKIFFIAEIGAYFYKVSGEVEGVDMSSSKTYFGGAGGLGATYNLTKKLGIVTDARYSYILAKGSSAPILSLNLGLKYVL